jgi:cytoskeleton protein RodZ
VASFGPRLKKEREQRGVGLEEIAQTTRIGTRFLRALEEEQFDQLPGGIFNKGFIRAYARHLGMDEEQAIADYLAATGAVPAEKKPAGGTQPAATQVWPDAESDRGASLPWGWLAIALLILALGFAAWSFYSREKQRTARPVPSAAYPAETPASSTAARTLSTAAQAATVLPARADRVISANPPEVKAPLSAGILTLQVRINEDSWLSITADGNEIARGMFTAPTQRTVRADKEIVVRAGNVGALDFDFNGKKLPSQGDYEEVKTLTFHANGLQPSPPKAEAPTQ